MRVARPPASLRPSEWTDYMARGRVSSALLLFGLVVIVSWLKAGRQWPDRRRTAGILVSAFVVALTANVAPEFVTALMVATLVIVAIDAQDAIIDGLQRLQGLLGAPPAAVGDPGRNLGTRPV